MTTNSCEESSTSFLFHEKQQDLDLYVDIHHPRLITSLTLVNDSIIFDS